ncbi:hypothetical protein [Parvibaculum sp.]|uniref:GP88 family protein n=1 Tax=Parvibaculum sp. TaxID=2024848 RepID=UPI001D802BCC|nr:hypothetical protein [Parvibaculum sp.]MBX3490876.1 hypothetical protein [Parvibaculum sp.]
MKGDGQRILDALFEELPDAGSVWPEDQRAAWLGAAESLFKLIYKNHPAAALPAGEGALPTDDQERDDAVRGGAGASRGDHTVKSSHGSHEQDDEDSAPEADIDEAGADGGEAGCEPSPASPLPAGPEALPPLTSAQARAYQAARSLLKLQGSFTTAEINARGGSGAYVALSYLLKKGYLANEGQLGMPRWRLLFDGEPHIEDRRAAETTAPPETAGKRKPFRRFTDKPTLAPDRLKPLAPYHPAVTGKRTLFPKTVIDPADSPALLVSGGNSRKIGDRVIKGPWSGMPIFTLTLEERATCPESCFHFLTCYGNNLHWSRRHRHGDELISGLRDELTAFQDAHPDGFVVRLHILGDFWSVDYVAAWAGFLRSFPALRVFGYTAWPRSSEIGAAIKRVTDTQWDRFAIRFSDAEAKPQGATTIYRIPEDDRVPEGIVCPAETGKTDCCGTCGLCWSDAVRDQTIVFVAHGRGSGRKASPEPTAAPKPRTMPFVSHRLIEEHAKTFAPVRHEPAPLDREEPAAPSRPGKSVPEDARQILREYLKEKGFQPVVTGKGRFIFKGRDVDTDGLIEMVNEMRVEDDLPEIELGEAA